MRSSSLPASHATTCLPAPRPRFCGRDAPRLSFILSANARPAGMFLAAWPPATPARAQPAMPPTPAFWKLHRFHHPLYFEPVHPPLRASGMCCIRLPRGDAREWRRWPEGARLARCGRRPRPHIAPAARPHTCRRRRPHVALNPKHSFLAAPETETSLAKRSTLATRQRGAALSAAMGWRNTG